jgi:hypothetical protein
MLRAARLVEAENCIAALEVTGYDYVQKYEKELPT